MLKQLSILVLVCSLIISGCNTKPSVRKGQTLKNQVTEKAEDVVFGSPAAAYSVIMYGSYNCTYCRLFFSQTLPELEKKYLDQGTLKLVLKFIDFNENPAVLRSLQAASCISQFGDYEKFHPLLLINPGVVLTEDFNQLLDDIMENNPDIAECILNNNNYAYLHSNMEEFKSNGLTGTPTFVFGNKAFSGFLSFDEFEALLNKEFNF